MPSSCRLSDHPLSIVRYVRTHPPPPLSSETRNVGGIVAQTSSLSPFTCFVWLSGPSPLFASSLPPLDISTSATSSEIDIHALRLLPTYVLCPTTATSRCRTAYCHPKSSTSGRCSGHSYVPSLLHLASSVAHQLLHVQFLAQCFNWALYGVFLLQVYIYYIRFPKDLTYIKVLVYTVLVLDSFFMGAITHAAWQVLVQSWGDINILHELPWTWAMVPVGSGVGEFF